jgi:prepilin signal peptidase PulO-like enzyme (type II secretory pathway)
VPVISWLFLRGKCRYCGKPISVQYPAVEAITASLFILSYVFWPQELIGAGLVAFAAWLVVLVGLIALTVYDIRWMILPNKIIFPLYVLVATSVLIQSILSTNYYLLTTTATGAAVGGGIFYLLFQVSAGKWIGGGDVKLGFLLGAIVGGPVPAFLVLFVASVLGSIFSVFLILKHRVGTKAKIAFGPFLIIATVIIYLWAEEIIDLYNNLLML